MVDCDYFRFGCNAKLPAKQLLSLTDTKCISSFADDSQHLQVNKKISATIDTVFPCSPCPKSYARAAFFHCANDLIAAKITPTDCLLSTGLGNDITSEEQVVLFNEIMNLSSSLGVKIVNQHTYLSDKTSLTFTFAGESNNDNGRIDITGELDIILTKPLGGSFYLVHSLTNNDRVLEELATSYMTANSFRLIPFLRSKCPLITDVSGFGFIGHLSTLAKKYSLECRIDIKRIEIIASVLDGGCLDDFYTSKKCNMRDFSCHVDSSIAISGVMEEVLYSGETNGPFIVFCEKDYTDRLLKELNKHTKSHLIGSARKHKRSRIELY